MASEMIRRRNELLLPSWTVEIMGKLRNHNTNTYRHSVRTGFITYALWKDIVSGKEEGNQFEIYPHELFLSGFVHDCGKLLIPAEILDKNAESKLSEKEQVLIAQHPYTGANMVTDDSVVVADIIRGHHRFGKNGIKYPDYDLNNDARAAKERVGYNIVEQAQIVLAIADKADVAINRIKGLHGVEVDDKSRSEFIERFQIEINAGLVKEVQLVNALQYAWNIAIDQEKWGDF